MPYTLINQSPLNSFELKKMCAPHAFVPLYTFQSSLKKIKEQDLMTSNGRNQIRDNLQVITSGMGQVLVNRLARFPKEGTFVFLYSNECNDALIRLLTAFDETDAASFNQAIQDLEKAIQDGHRTAYDRNILERDMNIIWKENNWP